MITFDHGNLLLVLEAKHLGMNPFAGSSHIFSAIKNVLSDSNSFHYWQNLINEPIPTNFPTEKKFRQNKKSIKNQNKSLIPNASRNKSGRLDSNQRPRAPQTRTLTGLSYTPLNSAAKVWIYFIATKQNPTFLAGHQTKYEKQCT